MTTKEYIEALGKRAAAAKYEAAVLSEEQKNKALTKIADALIENTDYIIKENKKDIEEGKKNSMPASIIDRLALSPERIEGMAQGVRDIVKLNDPVGEVLSTHTRPNGLVIKKVRVPMGVIGIIFEARPNVTSDAAAICLKAGSAVILRGGKDAIFSNTAIVGVMKKALKECDLSEDLICFVEDTSRESSNEMLRLNKYIDLLIPRGGAGLIKNVVENATVPVIQTGTGNCHAYVDKAANFDMALDIIYNAKTSRVSVCNALESIVLHSDIADEFLPLLVKKFAGKVEIFGDERAKKICPEINEATQKDFYTEYLDYKVSIKILDSAEQAIKWINEHSTMHSEVIITDDEKTAEMFLTQVDSSSVYHNASTRFTDGGEFGLGAEIGISTQKLHARGPMGIEEITSYKYIISGNGQIR